MSYICNSLFLDGDIDVSSPHHRNHFLWDHTAEDVVLACSRWRLHDKMSVSGHVSTTLAMYYCICDNHHDPIPQKRLMNHLGLYYQDHHHTFLTQGVDFPYPCQRYRIPFHIQVYIGPISIFLVYMVHITGEEWSTKPSNRDVSPSSGDSSVFLRASMILGHAPGRG